MPIMWEAVRILEGVSLEVLCITADSASQNRNFSFIRHMKAGIVYKPFSEDDRWLLFVAEAIANLATALVHTCMYYR